MRKPAKDNTIFFIGAMAFIVIFIVGLGVLVATGRVDLKSTFAGIGKAITSKKTEISDQATSGVKQMKAQIAKAVSGNTLTATVTFKLSETLLEESQWQVLEPIRAFCVKYPTAVVTLRGYADPSGNAIKNVSLSIQRTMAVKNYFVTYGCRNIEDGGLGSKIPERQVIITATN